MRGFGSPLPLVSAVLATILCADAQAAPFSNAALDTVVGRYLHDGRVHYGGPARDRGPLDRYLQACAGARPDAWSRTDQIAFWVNAYNARVLDGVIRHPGISSVLDVGRHLGIPTMGFFREKRVTGGRSLSLNDIEHELRTRYHEPRIHFVLNCASASCPVVPGQSLTGVGLEAELEGATARFLTDPARNHIDPLRGLEISSLFKWYGGDFRAEAGSIQAFIERHWPRPGRFTPNLTVRYLDYDWSLNGSW